MKNVVRTILCCLCIFALWGCKSRYELLLSGNDAPAKYSEAFSLFNAGKYKKAAAMFESLAMLTSGTDRDDTVRYYWGLSNYRYKDYITAEANFSSFIDLYPRSPFSSEARFLRIDCMYRATYRYELDQTPTRLAIVSISEYLMEFPDSENAGVCREMLKELNDRLDTKAFENARLYYKMEDYIAARTALKNILKDDYDNIYREEILYYIAKADYNYARNSVASKQKERYLEFVDAYYNFISEVPDSKYRKELDQLYGKSQKYVSADSAREKRKSEKVGKASDRRVDKMIKDKENKKDKKQQKKQ